MNTQTLDFTGPVPLIDGIPVYPIFGSAQGNYGISNVSDVLVSRLRDGTDLNEVWEDVIAAPAEFNKNRLSVVTLLSYMTPNAADAVWQNMTVPSFEEATEHGVPKSAATPAEVLLCGFTRKDWDLRTEFTCKFLREADRRQVDAIVNSALAADNQLLTGTILRRLFNPAETRNEFGHRVFGLWNGTDGLAPPDHLGQTFPTTTTHYVPSQNAVLDSADLEDSARMIQDKGYGVNPGSHLLIFANPQEADLIQGWRAGKESRTGGPVCKFDYIPSQNSFPYLSDQQIVGQTAPTDYNGLEVLGSYGPMYLTQSHFIPKGYLIVAATSGPNSDNNAVGVRVHELPEHQGLRLLPGSQPGYPLINSFYSRCMGTGVRHRSAAVCVQVTASSAYTKPAHSSIPV
jgi:hypothetical protein